MGVFDWLKRVFGLGEQKEPATLPIAKKPSKPEKYFTLGIDFGTHGTKLAYRASDDDFLQSKIITLKSSGLMGRSESVFPSLIGVYDGILTFGNCATNGNAIENFKMRIGLNDIEPISGIAYEDLTVLFLSSVLGAALNAIESENPDYRCKIMLHLGAPCSDLHDVSLRREAYDRILTFVWRIYHNDKCPGAQMRIEAAKSLISSVENRPVPKEEEWRWLVPELQAVATSYAQNTNVPRGTYHIVIDMGGFTTDVSIFNTGSPDQPQASIFASDVIPKAIVAHTETTDAAIFISDLRVKILRVIDGVTNGVQPLLPAGQFVHFWPKSLWRIGGGHFRPDIMDILLSDDGFLPGYQHLDRNPQFNHNEDRLLLCVKGLATLHSNLIAIVQANPLPPFLPPPDDGLPYHLQDNN